LIQRYSRRAGREAARMALPYAGAGAFSRTAIRTDEIADPGPLLGRLRACRDEIVRTTIGVKPFGVVYHALSMVVAAIDSLATFSPASLIISWGSERRRIEGAIREEREKLKRERGDP
jgi:hypothetical protein